MKYLLDTNICIEYLRGRNSTVRVRLQQGVPNDIAVPATVKAELHGLHPAARSEATTRSQALL